MSQSGEGTPAPAPADAPGRAAGAARDGSAGMGPDRLHRLRRAARAHQAAAPAVRRAQGLAGRPRVRGRHRRLQPDARPGLHPAGHLLRLAAPRARWRPDRRRRVHHPRPDRHPRPVRAVRGRFPAAVGARRRGRRGRRRARRRGPGRLVAARPQLAQPRLRRPLARLPRRRARRRRDHRRLAGPRAARLRRHRAPGPLRPPSRRRERPGTATERGCTVSSPRPLSCSRPGAGCWRRWRGWRSRSAACRSAAGS